MAKTTGSFGYLFCLIALFFFISGFLEQMLLVDLIPILSVANESLIACVSLVIGIVLLQIKKVKST
ncbi:hypothetical protein ABET51_03810 [Metabacillus fastidiosus]|uniref:hypothetical protein n=1 Tax=Metabacillus fastidiosus TaxID=1458 RepID=UPI002E1C939D|nr:hypothetical protein [Metabacillus fastidiosus]